MSRVEHFTMPLSVATRAKPRHVQWFAVVFMVGMRLFNSAFAARKPNQRAISDGLSNCSARGLMFWVAFERRTHGSLPLFGFSIPFALLIGLLAVAVVIYASILNGFLWVGLSIASGIIAVALADFLNIRRVTFLTLLRDPIFYEWIPRFVIYAETVLAPAGVFAPFVGVVACKRQETTASSAFFHADRYIGRRSFCI